MTVKQLIEKLNIQVARGYGDKEIFVEDSQDEYHIDSIQKNTHPDIEPEYLFIMAGERKNEEV